MPSDFRHHKCSDIRDKIFALSALPDAHLADRGSHLQTDYSLTDEELYLSAIAYWETLLWDGNERSTRRLAGTNRGEYAYSLIKEAVEVLRLQAVENWLMNWDALEHRAQFDPETDKRDHPGSFWRQHRLSMFLAAGLCARWSNLLPDRTSMDVQERYDEGY